MAKKRYDFAGWATRNDLLCNDGRTIKKNAFVGNDGKTVPLVWNHDHNSPENVLGHALLENRDTGVYAYCTFNDSESGRSAKEAVKHGDVRSLSIYANKLKQVGGDVVHGTIRELSLVLAGANPGAYIESVMIHGEEAEDAMIIGYDENLVLYHADDEKKDDEAKDNKKETEMAEKEKTVGDVFNELTEEQKNVVYALIGQALEDAGVNMDEEGDSEDVKHNLFDMEYENDSEVLMHSAMEEIIADGKRYGSLKESFLAHAEDYGINDIEYLFPDARTINNTPDFIQREMGWVQKIMGGTHHTPFSRIKSIHADITEDDARARGYIKGNLKKEEVFSLLKRTTTPTTIYKKQKLDRDDVIDIVDFDVVSWLKGEMRMMLDEEIARAILVGDGRLSSSDDKINEQNIRPIWTDSDLYTVKALLEFKSTDDENDRAKAFIKQCIKSRKEYKGSGQPTLFTTEDMLTDCLLLEDGIGRPLYETEQQLATKLRVKEIVTVEVMENLYRTDSGTRKDLLGIIVNPTDYTVGADKGGAVSMFDDFDIDYNQQKYLIETRCSGALTKPYSAIAVEFKTVSA